MVSHGRSAAGSTFRPAGLDADVRVKIVRDLNMRR
jgi:hypothetical protein